MKLDLDRLRTLTTPEWTREREDAVLRRLQQSEPRSGAGTLGWIAGGVVMAAAIVLMVLGWPDTGARDPARAPEPTGPLVEATPPSASSSSQGSVAPAPAVAPPATAVTPLLFRDGSEVVPDGLDSDLIIAEAGPSSTRVELRRGGARFDITPNPDRRFRVEAGLVTVDVLGTEFHCHRKGEQVTVEVLRGRVSVSWPGHSVELKRGESGRFPPEPEPEPDSELEQNSADGEARSTGAPPVRHRPPASTGRWRGLARDGDAAAAYASLNRGGKVANRAEELMLAADVCRKAGHPTEAIPYLERVLEQHAANSRAPLAAFTIGRIEFSRGRYRSAAKSFARVQTMKTNALVEHALAREIEAWVKAGDRAKAKRRAEQYVARYPDGPRIDRVRRVLEPASR